MAQPADRGQWRLCVDTGGTFTDCLAIDPRGREQRFKVLSSSTLRGVVRRRVDARRLEVELRPAFGRFLVGMTLRPAAGSRAWLIVDVSPDDTIVTLDSAIEIDVGSEIDLHAEEEPPTLAARIATNTAWGEPLPPIDLRLATTRATNALLEGRGAAVAFFVTEGFADLLLIGDQTRPDIFAISPRKPRPLHDQVFEVRERLDAEGRVLRDLDVSQLRRSAIAAIEGGAQCAAVALLHSYRNPVHEVKARRALEAAGFEHVSCSHELAPLIRILPRAQTAVVDAYIAPVIGAYLDCVRASLGDGALSVMTSAGGMARVEAVAAKDCLLSGPAGGVVGAAVLGRRSGAKRIIGFDMGGTSTDVCRYDGDFQYRFEQSVGPARIFAPALAIETVAAGGGSVCEYRHRKLVVGPRSAGASPGPACYGRGGPLTLTDVNLLLGRLDPDRFGIPLRPAAAQQRFEEIIEQMASEGTEAIEREVILEGLLAIADARMADAIAQVSLRQGADPAEHALLAFGGAGGQHACRVAEHLGISRIIMPRDASILSAVGLRHAVFERVAERQVLATLDDCADALPALVAALEERATSELAEVGFAPDQIARRRTIINARLLGQNATLSLDIDHCAEIADQFARRYRSMYGHAPGDAPIEIESVRVVVSTAGEREADRGASDDSRSDRHHPAETEGVTRAWFVGAWRDVPAFERAMLRPGATIAGPAIVYDASSTFIVEPGWRSEIDSADSLILSRVQQTLEPAPSGRGQGEGSSQRVSKPPHPQPLSQGERGEPAAPSGRAAAVVRRDLFMHRFTAIAREMGEMLERTALSTNVKERRDFSCAVLDPRGHLLVNAPHMPVHLGALGMCTRMIADAVEMSRGDVIITNHPGFGGSHLPDITLLSPVFDDDDDARLIGYVANRAHHAEIGGARPGSMPPRATTLAEEGVVIAPMHLVRGGVSRIDDVEALLRSGPHPSRAVADNLADIRAALAANEHGTEALRRLVSSRGFDEVQLQMRAIFDHASTLVRAIVDGFDEIERTAEDHMDDGSRIRVTIRKRQVERGSVLEIDFSGTSESQAGNLNAVESIVHSAVLYVLRLLLGEAMPLNEGIMEHIRISLPRCFLNPEFPDDPTLAPAVVGGNVETSQRIVDVLLKVFGLAAASQGTMNNTLFGDPTFGYYETVCGGAGAAPGAAGESAVHTHMTNTRLTDPEVLEHSYPLRLERFAIRRGSGGGGLYRGGDGVIREMTFLRPLSLSMLTQRRTTRPFGMEGGGDGMPGRQRIVRPSRGDGEQVIELLPIDGVEIKPGDRLILETPGGGGWGKEVEVSGHDAE